MITEEILNRKGVRKVQDIPEEVLVLLNAGKIESVNLTEWLAIDHVTLIQQCFGEIGIDETAIAAITQEIANQKKPSAMSTTKLVGALTYEYAAQKDNVQTILENLQAHTSDSIRCYAPFLIALNTQLSITEKLKKSLPLVADHHFGIREVVWLALRPNITEHLEESIQFLTDWTKHEDENIRRFTSEATRPRGVWCKHIDVLKESPQLALPLLEPLKSDPAKYVQDSVGNWLNDASKTQPDFVIDLCDKWEKESSTKETGKIIKKAMRTINKK